MARGGSLSLSLSVFSRVSQKSSRLSLYVFRGEKNRIFMTRFLRNLQLLTLNSLSLRSRGRSLNSSGRQKESEEESASRALKEQQQQREKRDYYIYKNGCKQRIRLWRVLRVPRVHLLRLFRGTDKDEEHRSRESRPGGCACFKHIVALCARLTDSLSLSLSLSL